MPFISKLILTFIHTLLFTHIHILLYNSYTYSYLNTQIRHSDNLIQSSFSYEKLTQRSDNFKIVNHHHYLKITPSNFQFKFSIIH